MGVAASGNSGVVDRTDATALELLLIVRHGETAWSSSGRHTGRTDIPLTDDGEIEARALRPLLFEAIGIDNPVAFSSPRSRAVRTAELCFAEHPVTIDDDLAEFDYGDDEGRTTDEIRRDRPGWDIFRDGCPGGETAAQVGDRADAFARRAQAAGSRVVVAFTHGHLSRILVARVLGLPATAGELFYNDTASIGVVRWRRGAPVVSGWNLRPPGATRPTG